MQIGDFLEAGLYRDEVNVAPDSLSLPLDAHASAAGDRFVGSLPIFGGPRSVDRASA
jgi:hypothetical protein